MCRAGGRRCPGSDTQAKARLRQRISRARKAATTARAAGDLGAAARAESTLDAARAELAALNAEHAAPGGDVTTQQHDSDDGDTRTRKTEPAATDMQATIREIYRSLARKPQAWVSLRELRPLLGGDRDEQDQALMALLRTGTCHLVPESNRKALTDVDREAAIQVGTEMKHCIAFDDEDPIPSNLADEHRGQEGDVTPHPTVVNTIHGTATNAVQGEVISGVTITDDAVRIGAVTGNTGIVMTSNTGGISFTSGSGHASTSDSDPVREAARAAAKVAKAAAKEARKAAKRARAEAAPSISPGAGDVVIGRNQGGVVMANGYTVVGTTVYRHPGRSVTLSNGVLTDAATGDRIEPTRTVQDSPRHGHDVVTRDGVLYVNGERVD